VQWQHSQQLQQQQSGATSFIIGTLSPASPSGFATSGVWSLSGCASAIMRLLNVIIINLKYNFD
tara:strand:+ start:445 stop:636 length:192 start_codon:yes stop_codon:yes gene_type:complete